MYSIGPKGFTSNTNTRRGFSELEELDFDDDLLQLFADDSTQNNGQGKRSSMAGYRTRTDSSIISHEEGGFRTKTQL